MIWRPALYQYLALWAAGVVCLRRRAWRYLLVLAPAVLHTGFLALCLLSQEFRYQYAVYVVCFAALPLLWLPAAAPSAGRLPD